jgi:hypothetical protein
MTNDDHQTQLRQAAARLRSNGLLRPNDSTSLRVPGTGHFLYLQTGASETSDFSLTERQIGEVETHRLVYTVRPDVGAVLFGSLPFGSQLHQAGAIVPSVFDAQLRCLGAETLRITTPSDPPSAQQAFRNGANAFVVLDFGAPARALCFGFALDLLLFNTELLEKCAKAYLVAAATGMPIRRLPWFVRWIATRRLAKDSRLAAGHFARGAAANIKKPY